jgi:hypothetical protein
MSRKCRAIKNYTELRLAIYGLILGKVSNLNILRVELCPLLDEHRIGFSTTRAMKSFFDRDYAILIRASNIKKVTVQNDKVFRS